MSIDVFGRQLTHNDATRGPPGLGFKLTNDGHFDIENRRLCVVADAADLQDAVNVKVLRKFVSDELDKIFKIVNAQRLEVHEISSNNQLIYTDLEQKLNNIEKNISALSVKFQNIEQEISQLKKTWKINEEK